MLSVLRSELLADQEVELSLSVLLVVESISPVDSEKSDDRQINPHADTGGTLDLERIEIADVGPAVTSLKEYEGENRGLWLHHDRIPELDSELVIYISGIGISVRAVCRRKIRGQEIVLITTEGYDLGTVIVVAGHSVTADDESLER